MELLRHKERHDTHHNFTVDDREVGKMVLDVMNETNFFGVTVSLYYQMIYSSSLGQIQYLVNLFTILFQSKSYGDFQDFILVWAVKWHFLKLKSCKGHIVISKWKEGYTFIAANCLREAEGGQPFEDAFWDWRLVMLNMRCSWQKKSQIRGREIVGMQGGSRLQTSVNVCLFMRTHCCRLPKVRITEHKKKASQQI